MNMCETKICHMFALSRECDKIILPYESSYISHIMSWPTTGVFEKQGQHGHEHTRIMPQSSCE